MLTDINHCVIKFHTFTDSNNLKIFDWYHIDSKNEHAKEYITKNFANIDNIIVKALLSNESRPRVIGDDNAIFLILKLINLTKNDEIINISPIKIWAEKNLIITTQTCELQVMDSILNSIKMGEQYENVGIFINYLIDHMLTNMSKSLISLDEKVSLLERILITKKSPVSNGIYKARQQLLLLEKYVVPQREVIYFLLQNSHCFKPTSSLKEMYNLFNLYADDADDIKKDLSLVIEENNVILSSTLSNSVHTLSIISVTLLPLHNLIHYFDNNFIEIWASLIMLLLIASYIIKLKFKK